uniref:HnRNP M nuclear localisation signal domain-containing protein n=1 Tax=Podarcis muralis TaxID=64176 RepID=A0A670KE42_PODMU
MRTRSRGRRAEKEQKMAAAVAAAVSEGGAKMAEAGALAGGGMAAANGAGNGVGEGVPKSEGERPTQNEKRKEKSAKRGGGSRFEPYASPSKRYRAFITNIPFDVKWQYLKDLVKEKGKQLCACLSCNVAPFPMALIFPPPEAGSVPEVILGSCSYVEEARFF